MTKLKLGPILDDKPVKLTVELPRQLHRDLTPMVRSLLGKQAGNWLNPDDFLSSCSRGS